MWEKAFPTVRSATDPFTGQKVAVLGGGDTALDDAAYLAGLAEQVYVIHRRKEFRGAAAR